MNNYINKLYNLTNKVAVVTGAGGHLCGKISEGLLKAGCKVALLDIRDKNLNKVSIYLKRQKLKNFITIKFDATKRANHVKSLKLILEKYKKIDILINGAGINSSTDFFKITDEDWYNVINSQLNSTFLGCQVFGKFMTKNKGGSIINISSASASPPLSKAFAYSASKAGIKNLTQNLGREWAKYDVRVNALRPGFFPTKWNLEHFIDARRKNKILGHTPMNRFGNPEELIGAVIWLSSDSAKFVTGAEIPIDGGFSCMTI